MEPSQTLYLNNLNDKINKLELARLIYHLCSAYGNVIDVSVSKKARLRGQAFVSFDTLHSSALALQELQDYNFLGKPIRAAYSKTSSDAAAKLNGTFDPKAKIQRLQQRREERRLEALQYESKTPKFFEVSDKLLVEHLHPDLSLDQVQKLFGQYPGLLDISQSGDKAVALYATKEAASLALTGLDGFLLAREWPLHVSFMRDT
jgi:U2 small nuclear ribonucleoprotein B''